MYGEVKPNAERVPNSSQCRKQYKYSKYPDFAAPTSGPEKVTFDYGPGMKLRNFKYNVKQLSEFRVADLKIIQAYSC